MNTVDPVQVTTINGRNLPLPQLQGEWLAILLRRQGELVLDSDLVPLKWHQIKRICVRVRPHGVDILRVRKQGYMLLGQELS